MKIWKKGCVVVACACIALSAGAQTQFEQIAPVPARYSVPAISSMRINPQVLKSLPAAPMRVAKENVQMMTPKVYATPTEAVAASAGSRAVVKPGTYYNHSAGYYHLVPNYVFSTTPDTVLSGRGVFGYIDRDLQFYNRTPEADMFTWDFYGNLMMGVDTIQIRPYSGSGYYIEAPTLTATIGTEDSTYQMGRHLNTRGEMENGMISTALSGVVYNVDIDAESFANTGFGGGNSWSEFLFGTDVENGSRYLEMYEAPADGGVILYGTMFYVWTSSTVDLTTKGKNFTIQWVELQDGEWKQVKRLTGEAELVVIFTEDKMRLWQVTAFSGDFTTLVKNPFYVMITGPQDGTEWGLMYQIDRDEFPEPERNTAYFAPSKGENKDLILQYVFGVYDQTTGELLETYPYNTSLDIHQAIVAPYIMMIDKENITPVESNTLDFSVAGERRSYYMADWYDYPGDATITATVSNSTDGDWLSITQPTEAPDNTLYFTMDITAGSLSFFTPGRRATITLTDNMGFSRDIVVYQGDREYANEAANVSVVETVTDEKVVNDGTDFVVIASGAYTEAELYAVSGQLLGKYPLAGETRISAASLPEGVYVVRLLGKDVKTLKVVK